MEGVHFTAEASRKFYVQGNDGGDSLFVSTCPLSDEYNIDNVVRVLGVCCRASSIGRQPTEVRRSKCTTLTFRWCGLRRTTRCPMWRWRTATTLKPRVGWHPPLLLFYIADSCVCVCVCVFRRFNDWLWWELGWIGQHYHVWLAFCLLRRTELRRMSLSCVLCWICWRPCVYDWLYRHAMLCFFKLLPMLRSRTVPKMSAQILKLNSTIVKLHKSMYIVVVMMMMMIVMLLLLLVVVVVVVLVSEGTL